MQRAPGSGRGLSSSRGQTMFIDYVGWLIVATTWLALSVLAGD